jgi:quercetin dioxygenase-like cupin family protein
MTVTNAATIDSLQAVPAGEGDHHFFLNHLATVKVAAGGSESGLVLVEFLAPLGFGPPLHAHNEEDELMYVLEGEIRVDLGDGDATTVSAGGAVTLPHGTPHTWQVVTETARFLTINAGRRQGPSFDQFVAALGTPTDPNAMPDPIEIDPAHVAGVCAAHGIDVLGPPPPPIAY